VTTTEAPARTTAEGSPLRPSGVLVPAAVIAVAVALGLLWSGDGRPAASPEGLPDPGMGTLWAIPVVRVLTDLSAALTVGLLLTGAVLVPARDGLLRGARLAWTRAARWSALVWLVCVAASVLLTLSDILALPIASVADPSLVWSFLQQIDVGRALLVQMLLLLWVVLSAGRIRTTTGAGLVGLLAVAALLPPTLTSHAGTSDQHTLAVSALMVHVVTAALWVGGLVGLVLVGISDRRPLPVAVPRFSRLALWSAIALALSGLANAVVRVATPSELVTTSYGRLVLLKVVLICVLAAFGVHQRRKVVPQLSGDGARKGFVRLAATEVLVMAGTIGVAVALARTPPPVSGEVPVDALSPARILLGFDLPPEPTLGRLLFGEMRLDGFWLTVGLLMIALYATGTHVMRREGDRWPISRSILWYIGAGLLIAATNLGMGTYAHVMFSVHMVQHMVLSMIVPIFLVLGAPVTLALRTLPRGRDQVGPREWLTQFIHSRYVRIVSNAVVASVIFVGSFYVLYFTELFPIFMSSHWGHIFMGVHFLLAGSLFFWSLIGVDPGPNRPPYIVRVVILLVVIPLHSFFNIAVLASNAVIAEDWYLGLQRPYAMDLMADQQLGASLAWALGEIPVVLVMIAIFVQWVRSDEREARRTDRAQDRAAATGRGRDELAEYNAYLARLADSEKRRTGGGSATATRPAGTQAPEGPDGG
jgi:putative copper resistance protein D